MVKLRYLVSVTGVELTTAGLAVAPVAAATGQTCTNNGGIFRRN